MNAKVDNKKDVLELGAGNNPHSSATTTVDIRDDLPHIDYGGIDIANDSLPFEDESFDTVLLFQVIEHIPPNRINHLISEIDRVLRPNGIIHIETPHSGTIDANTDLTHYGSGGTTPDIKHYFDSDGEMPCYWPKINWDVSAWANVEVRTILRPSHRISVKVTNAALSQAFVKIPFVTACVIINAQKRSHSSKS